MHPLDDTIAAVASPPGGAARGIVRLSGPGLRTCLEDCFRPAPHVSLPVLARPTAVPGFCWAAGIAAPLPCELYLWPGRRSYTGQPVAEIHTLGSPPLLDALLHTVCAAGARPAEPGEFTLRAFLAGRIDLTQAEAVLGVIDAADPAQLHVALTQLAGGLARPLHRLHEELLNLLAELEAGLDFADEDLPLISADELLARLDEAAAAVAGLLGQMASRQETGDLVRVVLAGPPNSGKSSLFNALAGAAALVSDQPGTTRDYLTAELDLDGVRCELVDTAGIGAAQTSPDFVSGDSCTVAQAVSRQQQQQADVRVICLDASRPAADWDRPEPLAAGAGQQILVLTKIDLPGPGPGPRPEISPPAIPTSSRTGAGLVALRAELRRCVLASRGGQSVAAPAARCRQSLSLAAECLARGRQLVVCKAGEELTAAEVRAALEEIGKVAGVVHADDVLDRIFSRFCIGK
jgi:tRNA modification GTPase